MTLLLRLAFWLAVLYVVVASAVALIGWPLAASAVLCGLVVAWWRIRSGAWDAEPEPDVEWVPRPRKRDPASPE